MRALVLFSALAIATATKVGGHLHPAAANVPLPTAPQVWYQQAEIHALIHFNMATFIEMVTLVAMLTTGTKRCRLLLALLHHRTHFNLRR